MEDVKTSTLLASISLLPLTEWGGLESVAVLLEGVARRAGFEVVRISSALANWQRHPALWAIAGELYQHLRVSKAAWEAARKNIDCAIVHAPAGYCPQGGLTIFHTNLPHYTRTAYPAWHPNQWKLRMVNRHYDRLSSRGPRRNVAVSRDQAAWLRKSGIRVDEIIYNPIDVDFFSPPPSSAKKSEVLGLKPDDFVVVSAGKFERRKNWPRLLALARQFPSFKFCIAGPATSDIGRCPDNCLILGYMQGDDLRRLYREADVFVSLSFSESFSLVLGEAMACGLPFISTPTGLGADAAMASPELRNGVTSATDWGEDVKILRRLSASRDLRHEMGVAAREFIVDNSAQAAVLSKYEDLLKTVVAKH